MLSADGSMPAAVTDDVNVFFWLFFRTRQLNGTCVSSVDMELFLHYSLIPSVSKGRGEQETERRGIGSLPYTDSPKGLNRSAERHQLNFFDLLSYIMHQKTGRGRLLTAEESRTLVF